MYRSQDFGAGAIPKMIFKERNLTGAFLIEPEKSEDASAFLAPIWSQHIFAERGFESRQVERNIPFNRKSERLPGMPYQASGGVRWNHRACGISPRPINVIAQRDQTYRDFVASDERDLENQE